jgi:hypothetical protein
MFWPQAHLSRVIEHSVSGHSCQSVTHTRARRPPTSSGPYPPWYRPDRAQTTCSIACGVSAYIWDISRPDVRITPLYLKQNLQLLGKIFSQHIGFPAQVPGPDFFILRDKKNRSLSHSLRSLRVLCQAKGAERLSSWWSGLDIQPQDPPRKRGRPGKHHDGGSQRERGSAGKFCGGASQPVETEAEPGFDQPLRAR